MVRVRVRVRIRVRVRRRSIARLARRTREECVQRCGEGRGERRLVDEVRTWLGLGLGVGVG